MARRILIRLAVFAAALLQLGVLAQKTLTLGNGGSDYSIQLTFDIDDAVASDDKIKDPEFRSGESLDAPATIFGGVCGFKLSFSSKSDRTANIVSSSVTFPAVNSTPSEIAMLARTKDRYFLVSFLDENSQTFVKLPGAGDYVFVSVKRGSSIPAQFGRTVDFRGSLTRLTYVFSDPESFKKPVFSRFFLEYKAGTNTGDNNFTVSHTETRQIAYPVNYQLVFLDQIVINPTYLGWNMTLGYDLSPDSSKITENELYPKFQWRQLNGSTLEWEQPGDAIPASESSKAVSVVVAVNKDFSSSKYTPYDTKTPLGVVWGVFLDTTTTSGATVTAAQWRLAAAMAVLGVALAM